MNTKDSPVHDTLNVAEDNSIDSSALSFKEISETSFSHWYSLFKDFCCEAQVIYLDYPTFLNYISADSIYLPDDSNDPKYNSNHLETELSDVEWGSGESDSDSSEDAISSISTQEKDTAANINNIATNKLKKSKVKVEFEPAKLEEIKKAIEVLGGKVIPRMNWSCPTDAIWITVGQTLKCENVNQILLLLQASDKISSDLAEYCGYDTPFSENTTTSKLDITAGNQQDLPELSFTNNTMRFDDLKVELVLRKYTDYNPALIFRCFVKNHKILGITQTDFNYYDFLFTDQDNITADITRFFKISKLATLGPIDFCFDVYIAKPGNGSKNVLLLDIEPWHPVSVNSYLFDWSELESFSIQQKADKTSIDISPADSTCSLANTENSKFKKPELRLFPKSLHMSSGIVFDTSKYCKSRFPVDLNAHNYQSAVDKFFYKK
ncbi:hypothetical protein BB561_005464 [Smittium simulii]|uniref:Uncharacterized protein n=1 Tax=Smittium simulii TaxID=133385 RepID=A0A2T9YAB1_9FUNG|nr:hypothetical protein BB561_005464 [Smittium simulii]